MENKMLSVKDINLLEAQNEGLKKQNAELQKEKAELKAENERLKEEIKELAHYLACMTEQRNKANTCLQEVKKYLKGHKIADEVRIKCVLDLITNAESEEK